MLHRQLRDEWCARKRAVPIQPAMTFAPEGLVLGAGTVVIQTEELRQPKSPRGHEMRLLALLSAFHGRPMVPSVLRNIERAAKAWQEGDDCLAYIHLAHAGLSEPQDLQSAAYRLEMAQLAMRYGASSRAVFKALHLDARYIEVVEKAYNPAEPRVSAGSGKTSGEWTSDGAAAVGAESARDGTGGGGEHASSPLGSLALPASSFLGELDAGQLAELGAYASRLVGLDPIGAAAAVFGLLFIPSSNNLSVKGDVPGAPGLSYSWNRDETLLRLSYVGVDGKTTDLTAQLEDDVFHDQNGNVVARVLPGGTIVVDKDAVLPDSANDNEPKLCPMPGLDKPGETGRDYEDYVKSIVNPVDTTPRHWGFQLINPTSGAIVYYDDCQHATGMMVEAKGPGYAELLTYDWGQRSIAANWLSQSAAQLAAAGTRAVRWYFAEPEAAAFAKELFRTSGRERIEIKLQPWSESP